MPGSPHTVWYLQNAVILLAVMASGTDTLHKVQRVTCWLGATAVTAVSVGCSREAASAACRMDHLHLLALVVSKY